jgi:prephenate dehydrogenase
LGIIIYTNRKKAEKNKGFYMTVGIVGLGLMGGSLALSLKKTDIFKKYIGYDRNKNHQVEAIKFGIVDELVSLEEIKKCDVIFLGVPVDGIVDILKGMEDIDESTVIIDLGSTKERIVKEVPKSIRKNLVAAHPMTGTEKSGPSAAFDSLYEDKVVVLCDLEDSGEIQKDIAIKIFDSIGMNIKYMNAKNHDLHASFISHMPHIVSFSLANSVMQQEEPESIITLAAGGFRDMSRIAKSSPRMWSDIFKQNKNNLLISVKAFQDELTKATSMIENEEWEKLSEWMNSANKLHNILK